MLSEGDYTHFHRTFSISSIGVPSGHRLVLFRCSVGVPSGQWFIKVPGVRSTKHYAFTTHGPAPDTKPCPEGIPTELSLTESMHGG